MPADSIVFRWNCLAYRPAENLWKKGKKGVGSLLDSKSTTHRPTHQ